MIIDRNLAPYAVNEDVGLCDALVRIEGNEHGMLLCLSDDGVLTGVLTDGDFRRWILSAGATPNLDIPVKRIANKDFHYMPADSSPQRVQAAMSERISFVPLLDERGRLAAIARPRENRMQIGGVVIAEDRPAFVIAEIGNNHNGDIELAQRLVDEAVAAGADCAKFQMRDMDTLYANKGNAADASEDLGSQYTLDLLSRFQLQNDDLFRMFDYCRDRGILPLCTAWDEVSVAALESYGIDGYKVASADLTNHDLLTVLAHTGKPAICSTGMSTSEEIRGSINLLRDLGAQFALLHCNSTYPAPFKDINLRFIDVLKQIGGCPVGYSSHDRGFNVVAAAVARGAKIIEKHFTLDRSMEGNDHKVSLEPAEFTAMITAIREIEEALGTADDRALSQGELMNRETLGKSLVVNRALKKGDRLSGDMLVVRSPGRGLPPYRKPDVIGREVRRDMEAGEILSEADVFAIDIEPRPYSFDRPFGVPVRYHDAKKLIAKTNLDLLEFHLSYMDMNEDLEKFFDAPMACSYLVHAPELFQGDHTLDLCSDDPAYRRRSMKELQRVIDIANALKRWFPKVNRPGIIVNVGGFTQDRFLRNEERKPLYDMVAESLAELNTDGVEILPQTMPPFPWHFGGQRYHNLFMDPDEIAEWCDKTGWRICLDLSHSKLACNYFKWSMSEFIQKVGPVTAHLHLADASGVDGEGLQILDGEIGFRDVCNVLNRYAPSASFIPEIWQGHKDEGAGFWVALERLEPLL